MYQTGAVRSSLSAFIHRGFLRGRVLRDYCGKANQSRGGIPRFHCPSLPSSQGDVVRIQGDEFWHMTRVLRLGVNARVGLFNGSGSLVEGSIQRIDKSGSDIISLTDPITVKPQGIQWHVFAAFGTLKGGRADWLIEKCTELGASSVTPLLTERCHTIAENRVDRLQRVVLAAVKQCQRLHAMTLNSPINISQLVPIVKESKLSFIAVAEATPLLSTLPRESTSIQTGLLIVGPEGDFTGEELNMMKEAGAKGVGLGPCRLRVETATIAFLSSLVLWSDSQNSSGLILNNLEVH